MDDTLSGSSPGINSDTFCETAPLNTNLSIVKRQITNLLSINTLLVHLITVEIYYFPLRLKVSFFNFLSRVSSAGHKQGHGDPEVTKR